VEDHHLFLQLVATFRAFLTFIVLGNKSPLFLDADQLYKIALLGLDSGQLQALHHTQPDWYAHVLWAVTGYTHEYFKDMVPMEQLEHGRQLPRPFQHINEAICTFSTFTHLDTPDELKQRRGPATRKQTQGQDPDNTNNKKPQNSLYNACSLTLLDALAKI